jgi:sterol 14-demethylase
LPIAKFRRRDRARRRLQTLVEGIVSKRESQPVKPSDMFQHLIDMRYQDGSRLTHNEITGMLISSIFAGHHTSSGTASWVLLELLKNPPIMRQTCAELDTLLGDGGAVTFQALREMPMLENVLKEVLRLHPPLIILMRKVSQDLRFKNYTIKAGDMVWASPPVTHRLSRLFCNPGSFDPDRFSPDRREDKNLMAYQPFGGGKHKCSGNAFATFQIKAIFAVLLRRYEFELAAPPETYVDDYTQMIVQPKSPCTVRYRRREAGLTGGRRARVSAAEAKCPVHAVPYEAGEAAAATFRIVVDRMLCQGHAQCTGEAPRHFRILANGDMEVQKSEVTEAERRQVEQAIRFCPSHALKLVRH